MKDDHIDGYCVCKWLIYHSPIYNIIDDCVKPISEVSGRGLKLNYRDSIAELEEDEKQLHATWKELEKENGAWAAKTGDVEMEKANLDNYPWPMDVKKVNYQM